MGIRVEGLWIRGCKVENRWRRVVEDRGLLEEGGGIWRINGGEWWNMENSWRRVVEYTGLMKEVGGICRTDGGGW